MIYRLLYTHLLSRFDAERVHRLTTRGLIAVDRIPALRRLLRALLAPRDPRLRVRALGLDFPSPLGLAAGFDKEAAAFDAFATLGFGYVEVGTITGEGQPGNAGTRVFRLPRERALVNRMGFPNAGAAAAQARLRGRARGAGAPVVGVNVGKTRRAQDAAADYQASVRALAPHADYLVLNVSSPNTPGLRDMQAVDQLAALIAAVRATLAEASLALPLLVKIAPDLSDEDVDAIADLALRERLDGLIATNTTIDRGALRDPRAPGVPPEGGISGAPVRARALAVLRRLHARTEGRLTLIAVGGIETADDAWERIRAGATLVQAYTGFVYGGPLWPWRVNRGLARLAREAALASVQDAVGADAPAARVADPATSGAQAG
ncbi:MAG: quinone-dependent dihydroorotate dehydrogenase [Actinobacteria bacterium]|nr:quinone-dependent dihydroorotate dehydrogenase [Actinomycetota bacterium]